MKILKGSFALRFTTRSLNCRALLSILVLVALASEKASAQISFSGLGVLPGGSSSDAFGVSNDGSVVVGFSSNVGGSIGNTRAFRWTPLGMTDLGTLPGGTDSLAYGVSGDGSVITGYSGSLTGVRPFRWTSSGMVNIGTLPGGANSYARGISNDGSVIVGDSVGTGPAFRWTPAGMVSLGALPGSSYSTAYGVSGDGSVVVGESGSTGQAYRWTSAGMVGLGTLPGGSGSYAAAVSNDGKVVVGESYIPNSNGGGEAFRWTSSGMVGLGFLPGSPPGNHDIYSFAYGVSGDGGVVVGSSSSFQGKQAFFWNATQGMQNLLTTLSLAGASLSGWTSLDDARAISADGTTIVGVGTRNNQKEAFIARNAAGWASTVSTTAPEPATLPYLSFGLIGLGYLAFKKRG